MVWLRVHEISQVSIYGGVCGGKDLRKRCVLIDGKNDDSVDPTCVV